MTWFGSKALPSATPDRALRAGYGMGLGSDTVFILFLLAGCLLFSVVMVFTYLSAFSDGILDVAGRPLGRDFINYWTGGVAVIDGAILQLFNPGGYNAYQEGLLGLEIAKHYWSYPPHMLLLLWPLGLLSYLPALALWSSATLVAYLWACRLRDGNPWIVAVVLLLAPSSYICLVGGQNGLLTAALLIGGFRLMKSHPILAGVLFGVLTVKPQLGILLPFALMASRRWLTIVSAGVTTVSLILMSGLLFGFEAWEAYFENVVPFQTRVMNEGTGEFLLMMPSAYIGMRILDVDRDIGSMVQFVFAAIAMAGVLWTFVRSQDWQLQVAVLSVGTFIASPYAFNYDMMTVSFAVAIVTFRALRSGFLPFERIILAMTWLLPVTVNWLNLNGFPIGVFILLACFGCLLLRVRDETSSRETSAARFVERSA